MSGITFLPTIRPAGPQRKNDPADNLLRAVPETLFVLFNGPVAHAHAGEAPVMKEVLHGHLAGQVGKEGDAVIGTFGSSGIAQG